MQTQTFSCASPSSGEVAPAVAFSTGAAVFSDDEDPGDFCAGVAAGAFFGVVCFEVVEDFFGVDCLGVDCFGEEDPAFAPDCWSVVAAGG